MKAQRVPSPDSHANRLGIPHTPHIGRIDKRLPPPSDEADDYTVALHGSEGNSFTPMKLSRAQLDTILRLEDRINTAARLTGFHPILVVYHGGLRNVGTKAEPVWEPAGKPVRNQRI